VLHQGNVLGCSVHDAAQRAADIIDALLPTPEQPRPGQHSPGQHSDAADLAKLIAVLRSYGEPDPIDVSVADLQSLRQAASELREVFAAPDVATAADRINALLAGRAHPPRLTSHNGTFGWHLHVDSNDDAPCAEWFITSSCLALAVLLAERQAPPAGLCASPSCGKPFVNVGRGPARRYCSPPCGTRERVAAHRQSRSRENASITPAK